MAQYIESFAFSYGALKILIDWASTALPNRPIDPTTGLLTDVAGMRIEFNSSLTGGVKDQTDPCAMAGFWNPQNREFGGGGLNIIQSDSRTKKYAGSPPNHVIEISPTISINVEVPDFGYVFFDYETLKRLNEYSKSNRVNNFALYGVAFKRTINTFKDATGVSQSFNNLLAYPYNNADYLDTFHNPQNMQDSMTYAIGVPCPPLWHP